MFHELEQKSPTTKINQIVQDIGKGLILLQTSQEGRMSKLWKDRNISYLDLKSILQKIGAQNINTAIKDQPSMGSLHLFHFTP